MWYTIAAAVIVAMVMHEIGHYCAARWFGVRVERMFLFFDANHFAIWSKKVGDTRFGIGWLPLGAYVTLAGMERMDDPRRADEAPLPWEFQARPLFEQCCILLAGVAVNAATALLVEAHGAPAGFWYYLGAASGFFAWVNLMPIALMDGERVVSVLHTGLKMGPRAAFMTATVFTVAALTGAWWAMGATPIF